MLKAIETVYNGYKFRSRLEARVAVFFHEAGIPYEYEKEGFDLDGLRYLPDFWLPEQDCWLEVKGKEPADEEREKAKRLVYHTGKSVAIWCGPIENDVNWIEVYFLHPSHGYVDLDYNRFWVECPVCHKLAIVSCNFGLLIDDLPCGCLNSPHLTSRLSEAYIAARSARFEHGVKP